MIGQSSVGKAKAGSAVTITDAINHPAGIERPESQMVNEHCDNSSRLDRSAARKQLNPTHLVMSPFAERDLRALERLPTVPDYCTRQICVEARRSLPCDS